MQRTNLKVGPIRDRAPVKLSIACEPELHDDLVAYADVHAHVYGKPVTITELIPSMLKTLIDSDAGFKRARRQMSEGAG